MADGIVVTSVATAVGAGAPVLLASSGELLAERVGVYNFGIEGTMLFGALSGFVAANGAQSWIVGLLAAGTVGALSSLLYAFVVVTARGNGVVAGIAIWFMAIGLTGQLGQNHVSERAASLIPSYHVPLLSAIPYVGHALFRQSVVTYLVYLLPFGMLALFRSRHGTEMRAIGEDPKAADAVGLSVLGWRTAYLTMGGALVGIAGGMLTLGIVGTWIGDVTAGQGWIALAIVFFAGWRPLWLIVGALLFAGLQTFGDVAQTEGWHISTQILAALPYVGTVLVLCLRSWIAVRRRSGLTWPTALGQPFYRS